MGETTSLSVDFSGLEGLQVILEKSSREPEDDNTLFVRAHGAEEHTLRSTSGSLARTQRGMSRYTTEFVNFVDAEQTALKYPNPRNIVIRRIGTYYDSAGVVVPRPEFIYNGRTNSIESLAGKVYGNVMVEYYAPYDLWLATFTGVCPSVDILAPPVDVTRGDPDDDEEYFGRDPMIIVAWKDAFVDATLNLDPPPCEEDRPGGVFISRSRTQTEDEGLVIDVDPKHPVALLSDERPSIGAGCRLRIHPGAISHRLVANTGELRSRAVVKQRYVKEVIRFNNTISATLTYSAENINSVDYTIVGEGFIDKWDRTFNPQFGGVHTYGDRVTIVEWLSRNTFENPIRHDVRANEIVITNNNKAVPCTGSIQVGYVVSYIEYDFEFTYDSEVKVFADTAISAVAVDGAAGTINLGGPAIRGFY